MPQEPNELPDSGLIVITDDSPDGVTSSSDALTKEQAETSARLKQVRARFDVHTTFWSPIHDEGLNDDRFVAGEQWPDLVRKDREEEQRPILTYNLLPSFIRQITNRARQERSRIKVIPVDTDKGESPSIENVSGTNDYSIADVYSGIIKNIEHTSRADQCYDTAMKHATDHGFGFFYLTTIWSVLDPFVQDLAIKRVKNSYSVTLDPDSQEADFRDGQDAFMFVQMKKTTFKAKYPGEALTEFDGATDGSTYDGWYDSDSLRVAQYYYIQHLDDHVLKLSNGKTVWESKVESILDELEEQTGIHVLKDDQGEPMRKKVKRPVCMWQKMTATTVLEGPLELPFSAIPIFPVLGEEMIVDGRTRYESAIRHAKDSQRSYNYWRTAAAETVALAPKAPWVATERQISGYEDMYEEANSKNIPVLYYNHVDGQNPPPPPQRQYPTGVAAAELSNAQQDGVDMQAIIGLHDASLGKNSNEVSGKAIIARKDQGSTSTFQFPDNLSRAQEQCGRLIVEAIPQIMDTQRVERIRLPDDTDDFVEINNAVTDDDTGNNVLIHDIAYGKYDVIMETGPSYATQRQEAAELQMELLSVLGPEKASNIVHLIVQNLGVPGSDEVSRVLRKMLPDSLKSEDEKIADLPKGVTPDPDNEGQYIKDGEPWQPPMTMEQQLMQKQQQIDELQYTAEQAKHQATQATAEADKAQAQAKMKDAEADIIKTQAEMQQLQQGGQGEVDNSGMMSDIESIIKQAMADHENNENAHKESTADQIADAIVDALKRTRAYVDKVSKHPEVTADPGFFDKPGKSTEKPVQVETPVQVIVGGEKRPVKIAYNYDDEGAIISAEPEYSDDN